jgi:hypothetical protein
MDHLEDNEEDRPAGYPEDGKKQGEFLEKFILKIMRGEARKPEWFWEVEEEGGDYWAPSRSLRIIPKDEKYKLIVEKMLAFLNSPECDGGRNG